MKKRHALLAATLLAAALAGGCSGDETAEPAPSCNEDPWSCADGQTCWPNLAADKFECFNAGLGQMGDACQNTVGQPTCGPDLACLQLQGEPQGQCTPYCDLQDPEHGCPTGLGCVKVILPTPAGKTFTFHVCNTQGQGGAGGSGGAAGAGGSGASGGAGGSGGTGG
jgi:hypothetical protein